MSIWDELWSRVRQTGDAVKEEATRKAAASAVDRVKKQMEEAADGFLDDAEAQLQAAEAARKGRTVYSPSKPETDADALIADAAAAQQERKPTHAEQQAARRTEAEQALAALKEELAKKPEDDPPTERTL